jgi:two-component system phosphate regulon sensor histidine kinase PhoR
MRLRFRTKLLASHVALVAAVVLLLLLELNRVLGADLERQLDARLVQQATGAAPWVGEGRRHPDKLAGRLALIIHADVTIFDRDGQVLAESNTQTPPSQGDSTTLPEVAAARRGELGRATRLSAKTDLPMRFVAVPAGDGEVLRVAAPLDEIDATVGAMRQRLLVASILAIVAALALGVLASRVVSGPLRAMTGQATLLAQGDYDGVVPSDSPDEIGILSRTLSSLAGQLKAKIGDLTTERDRLSAILAGMVEGVLVIDGDGLVNLANPAAAEILDAKGDPTGKRLAEVVLDPQLLELIDRAAQTGVITESDVETKVGGGRSLALYVRPLVSTRGAPGRGGTVAVLRDMTRVRRLMTMRRDFVANVSHELRTPVTAVQGYAETLLRSKVDDATQHQFLEIIHRQAMRIGSLVAGLLRLSELEARPPEQTVREPVDVAAVANNVVETMRDRALSAKCALRVDLDGASRVLADPAGLEQVLENLVDNALKYGASGGEVSILGKKKGERVELAVADKGAGIEPQHLSRVFERFYRVDAGRSRDQGGSGLGLAIVKHLVESMGGTVEVTSQPRAGARFTVDLPAA